MAYRLYDIVLGKISELKIRRQNNQFKAAKLFNWIAPSTKNAAIQFDLIIEHVKKEKKLYPEHGDNGGIMAYVAVHMMEAQNNLMDEINQISFSTLICAGTEDKFCSVVGTFHDNS